MILSSTITDTTAIMEIISALMDTPHIIRTILPTVIMAAGVTTRADILLIIQ